MVNGINVQHLIAGVLRNSVCGHWEEEGEFYTGGGFLLHTCIQ